MGWIVMGVLGAVAALTMPQVPRWVYHWRHAAHVVELTGTEPVAAPEYGSMIYDAELDWRARNELSPLLPGWSAADLAGLHDAPTVLDDLESSGPLGQWAPEGIPGSADEPRNVDATGAGDESEGYGLTAPPAPTRLLRTTGELLNAELLAECTAFMARQDTEVAVWLASASQRWAAA